MIPKNVLDRYYLSITLLVTVAYQLSGFAIAFTFKFDKITDFTGGSNFFILALITLTAGNTYHARNIVASVFLMVWAARLAGFLLFRVLRRGSDSRFDDIRSHFFKFLGFWIGQIIWVWTVSLPLTILNSPAVSGPSMPDFGTAKDIAGIIMWTIGWSVETLADIQKYRFKSKNHGPDKIPRSGIWAYSRHPPYFGEILCWWGIWILCLSPTTDGDLPGSTRRAQYGSVVSPLLTMTLLLFASGVPTAEKPVAKRFYLLSHGVNTRLEYAGSWEEYKRYIHSTSILLPLPQSIYSRIPRIIKSTLLLDFPMYSFDENVDGPKAIEEDRQKHEEASP